MNEFHQDIINRINKLNNSNLNENRFKTELKEVMSLLINKISIFNNKLEKEFILTDEVKKDMCLFIDELISLNKLCVNLNNYNVIRDFLNLVYKFIKLKIKNKEYSEVEEIILLINSDSRILKIIVNLILHDANNVYNSSNISIFDKNNLKSKVLKAKDNLVSVEVIEGIVNCYSNSVLENISFELKECSNDLSIKNKEITLLIDRRSKLINSSENLKENKVELMSNMKKRITSFILSILLTFGISVGVRYEVKDLGKYLKNEDNGVESNLYIDICSYITSMISLISLLNIPKVGVLALSKKLKDLLFRVNSNEIGLSELDEELEIVRRNIIDYIKDDYKMIEKVNTLLGGITCVSPYVLLEENIKSVIDDANLEVKEANILKLRMFR